ncbi:MAG TPA: aspartate-semialdehyde dehydrogenase [Candidatus Lokiarchaeia archaeon]|nr:aspartate-semialdehyde dehydrogenase [Candidatus Lokiarchaeia archaeon]
MEKIKIGVLGATGMVGQQYIKLLNNHPWFEVTDVAASPQSAGKCYADAVSGKWALDTPIPEGVKSLIVRDVQDYDNLPEISFVFSAVEMPNKDDIKAVENKYAEMGYPVVSNNSVHRWTPDVPMLIQEINHDHLKIIPAQQENHGWEKGFIVVKPNCSVQSYLTPIYALNQAGFKVDSLIITTLQATSGAGYPGVASLDLIDNVVPFIPGEEEKSEKEPLKILGKIEGNEIVNDDSIKISATCTRVPVTDGHVASVNMKFADEIPSKEQILSIWKDFRSVPQELGLPMAPEQPIIYLEEENRPQPRKDRNNDKGMAITIGRLRKDNVFDWKFVALSHNTIRGAAGGGVLSAELLKAQGYIH